MIPIILPLVKTIFDESVFLRYVKETIDLQLTSESKYEIARQISLMSNLFYEIKTDISALQNPGLTLQYSYFGFLIICDHNVTFDLCTHGTRHIVVRPTLRPDVDFIILSGTLSEWRDVIINYSDLNLGFGYNKVVSSILSYFDSIGLNQLFYDYRRIKQKDGTLLLEHKK